MTRLMKRYRVEPGRRLKLTHCDPGDWAGYDDKDDATQRLARLMEKIETLQERLYAEARQALLIVLQGMDTSGKDGTIRKVLTAANPQSCRVVPFKVPTPEERAHDFLWRIHPHVPPKGYMTIFNRSHYEDVLITRVHGTVSDELAAARFEQIKDFERLLAQTGTRAIKFFLHISKDEQRERLEARLKDPQKRWKFNAGDLVERKYWNDYLRAYEDALSATSTRQAPWFVIPANHKWVRNVLVAEVIVSTLEEMDPRFPKPPKLPDKIRF